MRIVEHDFSEIVKRNIIEDKVSKIGEIDGVGLYYDNYRNKQQTIIWL